MDCTHWDMYCWIKFFPFSPLYYFSRLMLKQKLLIGNSWSFFGRKILRCLSSPHPGARTCGSRISASRQTSRSPRWECTTRAPCGATSEPACPSRATCPLSVIRSTDTFFLTEVTSTTYQVSSMYVSRTLAEGKELEHHTPRAIINTHTILTPHITHTAIHCTKCTYYVHTTVTQSLHKSIRIYYIMLYINFCLVKEIPMGFNTILPAQ